MNFVDPSISLLAAAGRDTVKIFDVSAEPSDPCILSYTPSSGCLVNSVKWNHTNLVVASAGDDRKISLWKKNGQVMGTIPVAGTDSGDGIEESILSISFSNKGSRYICSGGSGQVVRIWDLQRKRCIKWLRGHTNTITGAMYNCKDEHLASISLSGDLILHNLASGVRASELKDPNEQVLRVLDYSRISRHLLVTAGDDGSVHLWDSTGRSPKVSWWKQHSAPTVGLSFSPSNDKIVASVGLDKKLYTFDTGSKKPSSCISYEAPFTSLAFRDDGYILVAGTSSGRVVFYDVRGKPQPFTVLRAYGNSEAVTSLCWQRSKPVAVDESNCSAETALLGGSVDDSILMPDPLPSTTSSSLSALSGSRKMGRPILSLGGSSSAASSGALVSSSLHSSMTEETPHHHHLWPGGRLARLHAGRSSFNLNDDMEVFSPLVEVQPITPSLDKLWDDGEGGAKKENLPAERKSSPLIFSSSTRKFLSTDDAPNDHPIFDWKPSYIPRQDDTHSPSTLLGSSPAPSSTSEDSSVTPPEAWGGERFSDKFIRSHPPVSLPSRFSMPTTAGPLASGSMFPGFQDLTSSATQTSRNSNPAHSMKVETSLGSSELPYNYSMSLSLGTKGIVAGQGSLEKPVPASLSLPRRFSTYADRMSTTSSFSDAAAISVGSPKTKKIGAETREQLAPSSLPVGSPKTKRMGSETREELLNSLFSRSDAPAAGEPGNLPALNGGTSQSQKDKSRPDLSQGSSFTLQLFQRTLEETLATFQKSTHEDMRNLHIEVLRQFHMQEMEMSNVMSLILKNQAELMKEVQSLRKENQQLRQLL